MSIFEDLAKASGKSVDELKALIAQGNADEAKARREEIAKLKEENEKLAAKREALSRDIKALVDDNKLWAKVEALKGTGFQAVIIKKEGEQPSYNVNILFTLPKLPANKSSGTGNRGGRLIEIFEQHATPDEKAKLATAVAEAQARGARTDSVEYVHRKRVADRVS
jgi:hypothetical protein